MRAVIHDLRDVLFNLNRRVIELKLLFQDLRGGL